MLLQKPETLSQPEFQNDLFISVKGAKEHNLKNLSVEIPRNAITVITGLSGSGKSSLAFDTIFAEGQRRYVESLSTYARQFLETLDKPDVENIEGLSPTVSIQQKTTSHNPRSTVGTVTEIYDYLRLLYARIAKVFCYSCHKPITSQTAQQMVDQILEFPQNSKLNLLAPIVRNRKGEYQKELKMLQQKGFSKVRVDGEIFDLSQDISLDKQKKHSIDVLVDRLILRGGSVPGRSASSTPDRTQRSRVQESVETALKLAEGLLKVETESPGLERVDQPPEALARGNDANNPNLDATKYNELLFSEKFACVDCGVSYPAPEPRTFSFNSPMGACPNCNGLGFFEKDETGDPDELQTAPIAIYENCSTCAGKRLKTESLNFKIYEKNISELCDMSIERLIEYFQNLVLTPREQLIAERILKEIQDRLNFLKKVGVDYLSLNRPAQTLSGGESQRIRLAAQLGSSLIGVTYVLDEPSIGLHQRDNNQLLDMLKKLRDRGNTVLVVEHDKDTIETADYILDLGPGAGTHGGNLIACGTAQQIQENEKSITGQYLSGKLKIELPKKRRPVQKKHGLLLKNITQNNLKNIDVFFPFGVFTCVTGISGSGKSTLVLDTLYSLLMNKIYKTKTSEIHCREIINWENIDKVIDIDQSPIGRTPRSNPATYTGVFSLIRDLFSNLPESKMRGFKPGRFSFNIKGGRCEKCQGAGLVKVEMHFLSDIYVGCDQCSKQRFNPETLALKFKGHSIADVLAMTIEQARELFVNIPSLSQKLQTLSEVGLDYITLGQGATTLSGGEAQRMKLAKELSKRATGKTFYILDEPSTGLHFDDVKKLLKVLHKLVDQGNTVVVIEHNMEIIKTSDHIIDLGPEGGEKGGYLIAHGTPEEIAKTPTSYTGQYLRSYLRN